MQTGKTLAREREIREQPEVQEPETQEILRAQEVQEQEPAAGIREQAVQEALLPETAAIRRITAILLSNRKGVFWQMEDES